VAVLVADAFTTLITSAVAEISYYMQFGHSTVFDAHRLSTSDSLLAALAALAALTRVALYLISAYMVAHWLYTQSRPIRGRPKTGKESRGQLEDGDRRSVGSKIRGSGTGGVSAALGAWSLVFQAE
jgi:hypothetical protein